ncbi:MAG: Uma2 family endonuclease [Synechococcales cyanobacterium C42_A2020_086]|nr:Uma2 family endonuclease [Synechococcales cyanobacterium C42_A2020_086]
MTTTPTTPTPQSTQKLTVADYLALDDAFEGRREFVDGEILEMPPESNLNAQISVFLLVTLAQLVPVPWLRHKDVELVVAGRVRMPDLVVLGEDLAAVLLASERNTITEAMPAPLLVVEVVSPGKANEDRDYRYKRSEYAVRGIPEYWIVDPMRQTVAVLRLVDGLYELVDYTSDQRLESALLPGLDLTVAEILRAGNST